MKLKRLLALLMAFGLVAAACGDDDDDSADGGEETTTTEAADSGGDDGGSETTEAADDGGDGGDDGGAPAEVATDFGVTEDTIRIGLNADLTGPFGSLVSEIAEAQEVYWEWVNDNGGIGGRMIETVVLDSGYATDKGIENYEALAQESEDGVLMISENTGSPITAAIIEDATDDNMLLLPLSWASPWIAEPNALGKGTTYCAESINGIAYLADKVTANGGEPSLAIISRPGEYGLDGAAGAAIAAEELGIPVVYDGTDQLAGDDRTAIISQLVDSGATIVWMVATGGETLDIFGNAVSQGFEAEWSGNGPSFNYLLHLNSDFAADFDTYWTHSYYWQLWDYDSSAQGMVDLTREMSARRPDLTLSDNYVTGWIEGLIVESILRQAVANGDLTRAGVVQAASEVAVDYKGLAPNQEFFGDPDDILLRESFMYDVSLEAFDLQPMGSGTGSTGLVLEQGPYTSDLLADYQFGGPCI